LTVDGIGVCGYRASNTGKFKHTWCPIKDGIPWEKVANVFDVIKHDMSNLWDEDDYDLDDCNPDDFDEDCDVEDCD
jgi:hypothetical protein